MATLFGPGNDGPYGVGLLANPLAAPGLEPLLDALGTVGVVAVVPALVGAALSMVVRYRHAGHVERQQLKWLLAVASVAVVAFTASSIVNNEAVSNVLYLSGSRPSPRSRWRSAWRSCGTTCTTSTTSSAGPSRGR